MIIMDRGLSIDMFICNVDTTLNHDKYMDNDKEAQEKFWHL